MSDTLTLILRPLPPEPSRPHWSDSVGASQRLRAALKRLGRDYRLDCTAALAGPEAWAGWRKNAAGLWVRTCTGVNPEVVFDILAAEPLLAAVLPRNLVPPAAPAGKEQAMILGFTGTRFGMTAAQVTALRGLLLELKPREIRHGSCKGADTQFHRLAEELLGVGLMRHLHPCDLTQWRALDLQADFVESPEPPLARNRKIVQASDIVIAAPQQAVEQAWGGTWSTWRLAIKWGKPTYLVRPDGSVEFTPARQEVS